MVRSQALAVLTMLRDESGAVVRGLVEALKDESGLVRQHAQSLLTQRVQHDFGDQKLLRSAEVVAVVRERLEDADLTIRLEAATFLAHAAPGQSPDAVPVFVEVIERGWHVAMVLHPLHQMGPAAKDAIPALEKALAAEKNKYLRDAIERTIAALRGE
jgi:hypothetical protein